MNLKFKITASYFGSILSLTGHVDHASFIAGVNIYNFPANMDENSDFLFRMKIENISVLRVVHHYCDLFTRIFRV